ncbi:MAG TPA: DUF1631 family protein [Rhodanobacteraceae bacterium]|nr:DUF1631 family protein [Rhodanobacteraceae bacterium]
MGNVVAPDQPLPPRALAALNDQLAICRKFLQLRLDEAIVYAGKALFDRSNQLLDHDEQERCLDALVVVKRHRAAITKRVLDMLPARVEHFGRAAEKPGHQPAHMGLSLLEQQSQDETLMLADLAARTEARATLPLFELGHRYAVLAAQPMLESAVQPFSPAFLCDCLRQAIADIDLLPEFRVVIYQAFDRKALQCAFAFYDELNTQLCESGILPHLRVFAPRHRAAASTHDYQHAGDADGKAANGMSQVDTAHAVESPDARVAATAVHELDARSDETYASLLRFLDLRRRQSESLAPPGEGEIPSSQDINRVLAKLQSRPLSAPMSEEDARPPDMRQLRDEMLAQLRQSHPENVTPRFNARQANTIELMTLLFDRLIEDIRSTPGNHFLSELQATLLRVAMDDQAFFTDRQHAARKWLETVVEASAQWIPDNDRGSGNPALVERIHTMNRAINRDFDGDVSIFDGMTGGLRKQLDQLAHRAAVTERHYVEAFRGRERLELARKRAEALIAERIEIGSSTGLTRTLLQHAWTDVLVLSLLKHGEDSDDFRRKLHVADMLGKGSPEQHVEDADRLRELIEQGLSQVGMEPREADLLARDATGVVDDNAQTAEDDKSTRAELALKLKQREPVGSEQIDRAVDAPVVSADSEHDQTMARIKKMAFGTWFEFDDPEYGKPIRRKMVWYSKQTGRCLFVNRRGIRTHDTTIDHLAQSMQAGNARVVTVEEGSFIDRALEHILASLRKFIGRKLPQQEEST